MRPEPTPRRAAPTDWPRYPVLRAVVNGFGTMTGRRPRDSERPLQAIEPIQTLELDQRVRELGEW
ncbi:hypothetical protein ACSFA2_21940 [Variovorax sp. LT2P21]|uniref:hypothetical protein n=1 Tax=Variovorax sp. LT2P21 TaxID=3443731 RepID=UPI003F463DDE